MESRQLIKVTQADIDKAIPKDSRHCAAATAIARALPEARRISVDMLFVKFSEGEERYCFATPSAIQAYIIDFDAGEEVHPFSFRLDKRNRMLIQRYVTTDEGRQIAKATEKLRRRTARATELAKDPATLPAERARAEERVAVARVEVEEARATAGVKPRQKVDRSPSPPTAHDAGDGVIRRDQARSKKRSAPKSHVREYGLRTMRINQARAARVQAADE